MITVILTGANKYLQYYFTIANTGNHNDYYYTYYTYKIISVRSTAMQLSDILLLAN